MNSISTNIHCPWIRICQECAHEQVSKPPTEYKNDSWTELKCKRCKSIGMSYGSYKLEVQDDELDY